MNLWEMKEVNVAYFVSGSGTNFHNLETYFRNHLPKVKGKLVIGSRSEIGAKEKANNLGITFISLKEKDFNSFSDYEQTLKSELEHRKIDLICLAGYLKMIPKSIISTYSERIINIHPALLPSFGGKGMYGIHVHEAVLEYGCKITGATTHFVTENYDEGQVILQESVKVEQNDTPESLQQRVLQTEYQIYSKSVEVLVTKPWKIEERIFRVL